MAATRLISLGDVPRLAELAVANREFMAPYEPPRAENYHTEQGQEVVVATALRRYEQGSFLPLVILDEAGEVVGRVSLNEIVRGPLMSSSIGYWVSRHANGRGLASAAVGDVVRIGFTELGLHRLEASTLVDNVRSQRVLAHHGFERYGLAPRFLFIGAAWQDHLLFQLLNPDPCVPEDAREAD